MRDSEIRELERHVKDNPTPKNLEHMVEVYMRAGRSIAGAAVGALALTKKKPYWLTLLSELGATGSGIGLRSIKDARRVARLMTDKRAWRALAGDCEEFLHFSTTGTDYNACVSEVMKEIDRMLNTFGVEAFEIPGHAGEFAEYCNTGETYDNTIIYDEHEDKFIVASWGDLVEEYENNIEGGSLRERIREIEEEHLGYSLEQLRAMPTLGVAQEGNRKFDDGRIRVWQSRMTREDGARWDYAVEIEVYDPDGGGWQVAVTYPSDPDARDFYYNWEINH